MWTWSLVVVLVPSSLLLFSFGTETGFEPPATLSAVGLPPGEALLSPVNSGSHGHSTSSGWRTLAHWNPHPANTRLVQLLDKAPGGHQQSHPAPVWPTWQRRWTANCKTLSTRGLAPQRGLMSFGGGGKTS